MTDDTSPTAINQRIFRMGLSVEAISIYLLACALTDAGETITRSALGRRWNGSTQELVDGIALLMRRRVLSATDAAPPPEASAFALTAPDQWQTNTEAPHGDD